MTKMAWKEFEKWIASYLGWKRLVKKSYGHSQPDVKGDGLIGECKLHKKFAIHTLKQKTDLLYKDDIIIFTKVKGTRYEPHNVLVTINIELFKRFLECYKFDIDNKNIKVVDNKFTILLKNLSYRITIGKDTLKAMKKIVKKMKELK